MQRAIIAAILPSPALCYFGRTQAPVLLRSGNLFPTEEVGGVGGPNSQAFCRRCFSRFVDGFTSYRTKPKPPWNVLFFGTDEYALTHLKALNANRIGGIQKLVDRLEVVVPNSKCAVRGYASKENLHTYNWPLKSVDSGHFDVGVVVSFGHLIPGRIINMFPYGILNVHPSILPRWRGASPIIHTILNGDRETGISVMEIRPKHFDVGPLLMQMRFLVPENCTTFQLRNYLAVEGSSLLMKSLRDLPVLEKMEYEQNEYGVTYAHKLNPVNARVCWEQQTPGDIDRQYRALSELFGLRSVWKGQSVRLNEMVSLIDMEAQDIHLALQNAFPEDEMTVRPGIAFYFDARDILCIRCKNGWVGFHSITVRKLMSAKSFYNGYLSRPEFRATAFESQLNELDKYMFRIHLPNSKQLSMASEKLLSSRAVH